MARPLAIRPKVLRAYYDVTFGKGAASAESSAKAFTGATFDEYFALKRMQYATIPRWRAAEMAPVPAFRELAKKLPREPDVEEPLATVWDAGGKTVDLKKAKPPPRATQLVLRGAKELRGFETIARVKTLRSLWARLCSAEIAAPKARVLLEHIDVGSCKSPFVKSLLDATSIRRLDWMEWGKTSVDLAPLTHHERLETLWATGPKVENVRALRGRGLRSLALGRIRIDDGVREVLKRAARTLRELTLRSATDIAPKDLPFDDLRALERVTLSVSERHRKAWIDLAVARNDVRFELEGLAGPPEALPEEEVERVHHGIEVLRIGDAKPRFRIESDVASEIGFDGSNGDLEDELAPRAKKAKKKVEWGSEADTFVATCPDVATCLWLIDEARELSGET